MRVRRAERRDFLSQFRDLNERGTLDYDGNFNVYFMGRTRILQKVDGVLGLFTDDRRVGTL
jgi:hypothetical protein